MENSIVSPTLLKQEAKKLKKEKGISHAEALDEVAKRHDFSGGWKHYLNIWEAFNDRNNHDLVQTKEDLLKIISLEKSWKKKVDIAVTYVHTGKMPYPDLFKVLDLIKESPEDVQYVCIQSTLHGQIQDALLNYFKESKQDIQALPLREHFVAKDLFIDDLNFLFDDGELDIHGSFVLQFKTEIEVDEQMKDLPHFRRGPMFGQFDITIDKDGEIEIHNPAIGEEVDGKVYMGPFKLTKKNSN